MTAIVYTIDLDAIARAHADHARRKQHTRRWQRNRARRAEMAQKAV